MSASSLIYHPGDLILSEKPFAYVVYKENQGYRCDYCLARGQLKKCRSCNYVHYCKRACQKAAWPEHKLECKYLKNISEQREDFVRLLGKVILKLKGKDWKSVAANVAGNERNFDDLISHREETAKDPKLYLHPLNVSYFLEQYLGQENLPEERELQEIIGKVKHNRFGFDGIGSSFYIGASVFDHSCIPNAVRVFNGTTIEIRAIYDITCATVDDVKKNITISYTPTVVLGVSVERDFFGPCKCSDCSLPYGDSLLTKIVDSRKAHAIIEITESALEKLSQHSMMVPLQIDAITEIFERQDGVLGDTNILRLKLLAYKCGYGSGLQKREDIKMFLDVGRCVFGPNSKELVEVYEVAAKEALVQGDVRGANKYLEELERLSIIHSGKTLQENHSEFAFLTAGPGFSFF